MSDKSRPKPVLFTEEEVPTAPSAQYRELCTKLGFNPLQLKQIDLKIRAHNIRKWFHDNGIPLYDNFAVTSFLNKKKEPNEQIGWVALSKYDKLIPESVLQTIIQIKKEFNLTSDAFTISLIRRDPDPFAAAFIESNSYIFAVWDEPGFVG